MSQFKVGDIIVNKESLSVFEVLDVYNRNYKLKVLKSAWTIVGEVFDSAYDIDDNNRLLTPLEQLL